MSRIVSEPAPARLWPMLGLTLAMNAGGLAVAVVGLPSDPRTAAALFPPWWPAARALAAAGRAGDIIALGKLASIVVVRSEAAGLATRLREAGALVVLPPLGAGPCDATAAPSPP